MCCGFLVGGVNASFAASGVHGSRPKTFLSRPETGRGRRTDLAAYITLIIMWIALAMMRAQTSESLSALGFRTNDSGGTSW